MLTHIPYSFGPLQIGRIAQQTPPPTSFRATPIQLPYDKTQTSTTAINSDSVVESITHFCNFDCQATTLSIKVTMHPEVDFRSSKLPARSEFVYPTNIGFLHPMVSFKFDDPHKYLITHFTTSQ